MTSYTIPSVVEKRPSGDRSLDIYSRLLSDRIVFLGTPIDDGVANVVVAQLILFRRPESLTPHFLVIPLDTRSPYAITILAGTITMTPGTVSADLDRDRRHLLVHALSIDDPEDAIRTIKQRYEAPLREIFG